MDIDELAQRIAVVETKVTAIMDNHLPSIHEDVKWIRERLNRGNRPTWTMTFLLTFLASLSIGLMVALLQ